MNGLNMTERLVERAGSSSSGGEIPSASTFESFQSPSSQSLEVGDSPQRLRLQSTHKTKKSERSMIRAKLVVTDPPDAQVSVYLDSLAFVLGRGRETDLILMDDGASREHARFDRDEQGFSITDLESGNGTFVNGRRTQSARLYDGDLIAIGRTRMRFETLGWRRIGDRDSSFMGSMLNGSDTPASDARIRAALISLVVGFLVSFLVSLALKPSEPAGHNEADFIVERARQAISDDRWVFAWSEINSLPLLRLEHEHQSALSEQIDRGLVSDDFREQVERALEDGRPISEVDALAREITSDHPHFESVRKVLREVKDTHSRDLFQRAKQIFWSGDVVQAKNVYNEARQLDSTRSVPYDFNELLYGQAIE